MDQIRLILIAFACLLAPSLYVVGTQLATRFKINTDHSQMLYFPGNT